MEEGEYEPEQKLGMVADPFRFELNATHEDPNYEDFGPFQPVKTNEIRPPMRNTRRARGLRHPTAGRQTLLLQPHSTDMPSTSRRQTKKMSTVFGKEPTPGDSPVIKLSESNRRKESDMNLTDRTRHTPGDTLREHSPNQLSERSSPAKRFSMGGREFHSRTQMKDDPRMKNMSLKEVQRKYFENIEVPVIQMREVGKQPATSFLKDDTVPISNTSQEKSFNAMHSEIQKQVHKDFKIREMAKRLKDLKHAEIDELFQAKKLAEFKKFEMLIKEYEENNLISTEFHSKLRQQFQELRFLRDMIDQMHFSLTNRNYETGRIAFFKRMYEKHVLPHLTPEKTELSVSDYQPSALNSNKAKFFDVLPREGISDFDQKTENFANTTPLTERPQEDQFVRAGFRVFHKKDYHRDNLKSLNTQTSESKSPVSQIAEDSKSAIDFIIKKKFLQITKQQQPKRPEKTDSKIKERSKTPENKTSEVKSDPRGSPTSMLLQNIENYTAAHSSEMRFNIIVNKAIESDKVIIKFITNNHSIDVFTRMGEMKTVTLKQTEGYTKDQNPLTPDPGELKTQLKSFMDRLSPIKPSTYLPATPSFSEVLGAGIDLSKKPLGSKTDRSAFNFDDARPRSVNTMENRSTGKSPVRSRETEQEFSHYEYEVDNLTVKYKKKLTEVIGDDANRFEAILKDFSCELFAMDQKIEYLNVDMMSKMLDFAGLPEPTTKQTNGMIRQLCTYYRDLLDSCFDIAPFHSFGFEKSFKFLLYLFEIYQQRNQVLTSKLEYELEESKVFLRDRDSMKKEIERLKQENKQQKNTLETKEKEVKEMKTKYENEIKTLNKEINELAMHLQEHEEKDPEDMVEFLERKFTNQPYRMTKNIGVGTNDDNANDYEQRKFGFLAKTLFFSDTMTVFFEDTESALTINESNIKRLVTDLFAYFQFNAQKKECVMKSYLQGNSISNFQSTFLNFLLAKHYETRQGEQGRFLESVEYFDIFANARKIVGLATAGDASKYAIMNLFKELLELNQDDLSNLFTGGIKREKAIVNKQLEIFFCEIYHHLMHYEQKFLLNAKDPQNYKGNYNSILNIKVAFDFFWRIFGEHGTYVFEKFIDMLSFEDIINPDRDKIDARNSLLLTIGAQINLKLRYRNHGAFEVFRSVVYRTCKKKANRGLSVDAQLLEKINKIEYLPKHKVYAPTEDDLREQKPSKQGSPLKGNKTQGAHQSKEGSLENSFELNQYMGTKLDPADIEAIFYDAKCYPGIHSFLGDEVTLPVDTIDPSEIPGRDRLRSGQPKKETWRDKLYKLFLQPSFTSVTGNDIVDVLKPYIEDSYKAYIRIADLAALYTLCFKELLQHTESNLQATAEKMFADKFLCSKDELLRIIEVTDIGSTMLDRQAEEVMNYIFVQKLGDSFSGDKENKFKQKIDSALSTSKLEDTDGRPRLGSFSRMKDELQNYKQQAFNSISKDDIVKYFNKSTIIRIATKSLIENTKNNFAAMNV